MSKYDPLTEFLRRQPHDRIKISFDDIEDHDKIGVTLPKAAREHREWWANEANPRTRHYQCRAWLAAGWKVEDVDRSREIVTFARVRNQK